MKKSKRNLTVIYNNLSGKLNYDKLFHVFFVSCGFKYIKGYYYHGESFKGIADPVIWGYCDIHNKLSEMITNVIKNDFDQIDDIAIYRQLINEKKS